MKGRREGRGELREGRAKKERGVGDGGKNFGPLLSSNLPCLFPSPFFLSTPALLQGLSLSWNSL